MSGEQVNLVDETLVTATLSGDKKAFVCLVQKYERVIYAITFQRLKHREDAMDITNETFMKAYSSLNTLKNPAIFKNWLFEIAVNKCQDAFRKRHPANGGITLSLDDPKVPDKASNSQLSDKASEHNETYQEVLKAIDTLPETYQTPLMLHLMEEMDASEISTRLEIPPETIRKQIYRGIQLLREKLQGLVRDF